MATMRLLFSIWCFVFSLSCFGAPSISYTSYFNNVYVYTNITLGGVTRNTWPSSGGIAGTVINTGASTVGAVPRYTDTTGTNVAPSTVTITNGTADTVISFPIPAGQTTGWKINQNPYTWTNMGTYIDDVLDLSYNFGQVISTNISLGMRFETKFSNGADFQSEWYVYHKPTNGVSELRPIGFSGGYTNNLIQGNLNGKWGFFDSSGTTQQVIKTEGGTIQLNAGTQSILADRTGNPGVVLEVRNNPGVAGLLMYGGYIQLRGTNGDSSGLLIGQDKLADSGTTAVNSMLVGFQTQRYNGSGSTAEYQYLQSIRGSTNANDAVLKWDRSFQAAETFIGGVTSPAQITGNSNNYAPARGKYLRLTSDATRQITGLNYAAGQIGGEEHVIVNVGSNDIILVHNSGSTSAGHRFFSTTGENITLAPSQRVDLWRDTSSGYWRVSAPWQVSAVVAKTADYSVLSSDSQKVFTNEGTTAKRNNTLPGAVAGLTYTFIVQDTDGVTVTAASGDTIRIAASVTGAAGNIDSTTVGNTVTLVAINTTEWIATAVNGTWTVSAP